MEKSNLSLPPELPIGQAEQVAVAEANRSVKPNGMTRGEFEEHNRRKRELQNQVAIDITNSFPSKLRSLLEGAAVTHFGPSGDAIVNECIEQNEIVSKLTAGLKADVQQLAKALNSAAASGDFTAVLIAAEQVKFDKTSLSQQAVKIWSDGIGLAARIEAELCGMKAPLEKEYEQVVADVRDKLTAIGNGLESQQAYSVNPAAAEQQFDFQARHRNTHARAAHAKLDDVVASWQAAFEQKNRMVHGLECARNFLHQVVLKTING